MACSKVRVAKLTMSFTRIYQCGQQQAGDSDTKDWKLSIGERFNIDAIIHDAVVRRNLRFQPLQEVFDVQLEVSFIAAHVTDRERAARQIFEPSLLNSGQIVRANFERAPHIIELFSLPLTLVAQLLADTLDAEKRGRPTFCAYARSAGTVRFRCPEIGSNEGFSAWAICYSPSTTSKKVRAAHAERARAREAVILASIRRKFAEDCLAPVFGGGDRAARRVEIHLRPRLFPSTYGPCPTSGFPNPQTWSP